MAREEETSAFLDYGNPVQGSYGSPSRDFRAYWEKSLLTIFRLGGISYSRKDYALISKLVDQFPDHWEYMINAWHNGLQLDSARNLGLFYAKRYDVYEHTTKDEKDYGWEQS